MIKTRLVGLLSHVKKYIVYTILWQWIALLSQMAAVFAIADLIERIVYHTVTMPVIGRTAGICVLVILVRFVCERMGARCSYLASVDVKRVLREKIYDKMLKLGASYNELVSSSEVVQVVTEGVEQLETYFGKYLPQLFYSLLAPLTLFAVLCRVSLKASIILLLCVPLIPVSIVVVQKIAKRLLPLLDSPEYYAGRKYKRSAFPAKAPGTALRLFRSPLPAERSYRHPVAVFFRSVSLPGRPESHCDRRARSNDRPLRQHP